MFISFSTHEIFYFIPQLRKEIIKEILTYVFHWFTCETSISEKKKKERPAATQFFKA